MGKKEWNSFGWTVGNLVKELDIKKLSITSRVVLPVVPLWILPQPLVDLRMLEQSKKEGQSEFEEIQGIPVVKVWA